MESRMSRLVRIPVVSHGRWLIGLRVEGVSLGLVSARSGSGFRDVSGDFLVSWHVFIYRWAL